VRPPYKPDFPCYKNKIPDLNGAITGAPENSSPRPGGSAISAVPTAPKVVRKASARQATATATSGASVSSELASRLNPFRGKGAGK
jgi:hypothetical protein